LIHQLTFDINTIAFVNCVWQAIFKRRPKSRFYGEKETKSGLPQHLAQPALQAIGIHFGAVAAEALLLSGPPFDDIVSFLEYPLSGQKLESLEPRILMSPQLDQSAGGLQKTARVD
jgi:hypothetical protein